VIAAYIGAQAQSERALAQSESDKKTLEFQADIAKKTADIAKLNARIAVMSKQAQDMITGGDGYCFLQPAVQGETVVLSPFNNGEFPLYDVQIGVTDQVALLHFAHEHERDRGANAQMLRDMYDVSRRVIDIGTLLPGTDQDVQMNPKLQWSMPVGELSFMVDIKARNGLVKELIRVRRRKSSPSPIPMPDVDIAYQVVRNGEVVIEQADGLPLVDGKPDWTYNPQ
jgi:hypothetical protein